MKYISSIFKSKNKGIGRVLGNLEKEIMEIIWSRGNSSVKDVHELLKRSRKIAYTTVMTVMGRLVSKGLLKRFKEGNLFIYRPSLSKEDFDEMISKNIMRGALDNYGKRAIASFVDTLEEVSPEDIEYLSKLVESKKREING
jgi:predicted transcriptional regulator